MWLTRLGSSSACCYCHYCVRCSRFSIAFPASLDARKSARPTTQTLWHNRARPTVAAAAAVVAVVLFTQTKSISRGSTREERSASGGRPAIGRRSRRRQCPAEKNLAALFEIQRASKFRPAKLVGLPPGQFARRCRIS